MPVRRSRKKRSKSRCKYGRKKDGYCKKSPVSLKIKKLIMKGYPAKQAIAIALSMKDKKRLGPRGGYKKSRRRSRKKSRRRSRKKSRRRSRKKSKRRSRKKSRRRSRKKLIKKYSFKYNMDRSGSISPRPLLLRRQNATSPEVYIVYEGPNENQELQNKTNEGEIGDIVIYSAQNQEGYREYRIIPDTNPGAPDGSKILEMIFPEDD